jgi:ATP-binding cassette ChvD family protein
MDIELVTEGLVFPEGPIAMNDGSVILTEMFGPRLTRVRPDGSKEVVAETGGAPNGAAIGPDGAIYVTNNGGAFTPNRNGDLIFPGATPPDHKGGYIQRVEIATGKVETIYASDSCPGGTLWGPNDLVFDKQGNMWFTDHGCGDEDGRKYGGLYYAKPDGSFISRQRQHLLSPNGVGLSPDEKVVYVADTNMARLWAFDIGEPGVVTQVGFGAGRSVCNLQGTVLLDSLAVEAGGKICVATLINGGITIFDPDGSTEHVAFPDLLTTNICFGGADMRDAWVTCSSTGKLYKCRWPRPGLKLNFNALRRRGPKFGAGCVAPGASPSYLPRSPSNLTRRPGALMAAQYIFQMQGLTKAWPGGKKLFENIWLSFYPDAKIGVVGVNGSGKSTLLKIMAGIDTEFAGEAKAAEGTKMGYLEQEPQLDDQLNVWGNVIAWCEEKKIVDRYNEVAAKLGEDYTDELMEEMTALQEKIDAGDFWDIDSKVEMAMDALRCPPDDAGVTKLSGGERRRIALARLLLSKPDMLLLDEPTNHLDAESVAWLQHHLENFPGCVILVTHDRYFLDQVTKWTLELDRGKGVPYEGNYSGWLEQKAKRVIQEQSESEARQRAMAKELEWVRSNARARQAKSKARLAAYDRMMQEQEQARGAQTYATIQIPPGPRLGNVVLEVDGLEKEYGDKILFKGLSFKLPPNGIVGVIGPNGAGKSTLFKLITKQETPDAGSIRLGETVKLAYVDQSRDALDPNKTVWQEISSGLDVLKVGNREINTRSYVGSFNFKGGDQQKKVGQLSGGERNRVHLAKTLTEGGNVILLDEPTNDLDIETLQNLEEALEDFAGCAVVISHDRWFLDRLCTHILAFEGDSHVEWFEGNFEAYEEDKKRRLGADSLIPKRIKFQKFGR